MNKTKKSRSVAVRDAMGNRMVRVNDPFSIVNDVCGDGQMDGYHMGQSRYLPHIAEGFGWFDVVGRLQCDTVSGSKERRGSPTGWNRMFGLRRVNTNTKAVDVTISRWLL
ncbi:hypothetical protein AB6A40_008708 [Gnathostoma spinigerum]|uniref:Uncharacterized protein n=1 Tax=Gnathostoma spinigerum TaxID=75299 RepID=A0ABD6EUY8_9BILA